MWKAKPKTGEKVNRETKEEECKSVKREHEGGKERVAVILYTRLSRISLWYEFGGGRGESVQG